MMRLTNDEKINKLKIWHTSLVWDIPFLNSFRKTNFDSIDKTSLSGLLSLLMSTSYTQKKQLLDLLVIEHVHYTRIGRPLSHGRFTEWLFI